MDISNQTVKQFHARRHVLLSLIIMPVIFFVALIVPGRTETLIGLSILFFVINLWRYNMIYITIGDDFITVRPPAPIRSATNVLFDEIKSVKYEPKKVFIYYCNAIDNQTRSLTIVLNFMEDDAKASLLATLHDVFKNKESLS